MVALDTLMGTDESIGFEDFLNGMSLTQFIFTQNLLPVVFLLGLYGWQKPSLHKVYKIVFARDKLYNA